MSNRPAPPLPKAKADSSNLLEANDAGTVVLLTEGELEELVEDDGSASPLPASARGNRNLAARPGGSAPSEDVVPDGSTIVCLPPAMRQFGRFELLIEMGRGGMATLYLARIQGPSNFEKLLAIKKIHSHLAPDEQFVRMFMDEARIAAMIHHSNVATIFDMGRVDDAYFIAMEYVHGQNLTDILKFSARDRSRFPWTLGVRIVADAATGLHAAHDLTNAEGRPLNVVHRDVSPQNILISYDGNVKVVDFGIAFAAEKLEHTAVGTLKGKAGYMSPEQTLGEILDRRSDIFSLGIVLWESVCLKRLFRESNEAQTILKVRDAVVPPPRTVNPDLPVELERILLKALARRPKDRFATAEELSQALEELLLKQARLVSRKQVATALDDMFHDRRKLKDEQIKTALETVGTGPLPGVGMSGTGTLSLNLPTSPQTQTRVTSRMLLGSMVVLVVVLVALGGAFLWGLSRGDGKASQRGSVAPASKMQTNGEANARPMVEPPEPREVLPTTVHIKVSVRPLEAKPVVSFKGKDHPGAVFEMRVPRSFSPEILAISAPGFATQTVVITPGADNDIPVTLMKLPDVPTPMVMVPVMRPPMRPMRGGLWNLDD